MERLNPRDVLSIPGLLSLVRLPLAAAFPFVVRKPFAAVAILAAAGLSDLLDGWWARRFGRATLAGAVLDPIVDKLFVGAVAVSLLLADRLSLGEVLLLGVRDVVELPLLVWLLFDTSSLTDRSGHVRANVFGKVVTALQFATVVTALFLLPLAWPLAVVSGASGLLAAATYWSRLFRGRDGSLPG